MGNIFNEDFKDFIKALNSAKVEYILVGGYSVILHGYARTTGVIGYLGKQNPGKLLKTFKSFC